MAPKEHKHGLPGNGLREIVVCLRDLRRQGLRMRRISNCGKRSEITRKHIRLVMLKTTLRERVVGKI